MKTEKLTMRDVFIKRVYERMRKDRKIFFLSADFGAPNLDLIRRDFKDRFINVGIAEQNLVNVATGLALEGFTVYAYAIAPFLTMRAYEQIRVNICLHGQIKDLNINLVGVGAGLSYEVSGPTHHCLEDLTIIRTLPNIMLFSPSDWVLAGEIADFSFKVRRPKYIRFDGKPVINIHRPGAADLEKGFAPVRDGERVCLVSTGIMTHEALKAAELLKTKEGASIGVIDVFSLQPLNGALLLKALRKYQGIITMEEGFINKGGLDSLVGSILSNSDSKIKMRRAGFGSRYTFEIGDRSHLHKLNKMDPESIAGAVKELGKIL